MIILEKPFCNEEFFEVKTLEEIKNSPANSTLVFEYCDSSLELYSFCNRNSIPYAVKISDIKELIFCSNLGAKYVFCDKINNAKDFQKIADNYLLDTKIVMLIDSLDEIPSVVQYTIDAVKLKGNR